MKTSVIILAVFLVLVLAGNLVMFTVNEVQQVVVTEFGKVLRVVKDPGLQFKTPWQKVTIFDDRLLDNDSSHDPIYTKDKKNLIVDNYARWRIIDPRLLQIGACLVLLLCNELLALEWILKTAIECSFR